MKAAIRIDTAKQIAPIDDRLYSSFIEHMGRAIYTGIYEPGHPAADETGLRQDVMDLIRPLNLPLIRYPGGNFLSGYQWEDGIGPKENRPVRLDLAWQALEPNEFGTDEFMAFCDKTGTQPMMSVNLGTGTPQNAANLVEYCNFPGGTYYSDLRKKNGHPEPYNIKTWCLGNEMDGPWQICAKTAEEYATVARESAKMMKWIDPSIELVACGSSNHQMPTFGSWERTVLRKCWDYVDYLSLHQYYENCDGDMPTFLACSRDMDAFIREVAGICQEIKAEKQSDKDIYLSFDEWNVWYHWRLDRKESPLWTVGRRLEEEEYNLVDALVVGCLVNTLVNNADVVKIACLAQLINVLGPIMTEPGSNAWLQTIYYPFALACREGRGTALRAEVECPSYACATNPEVPYLDLAAVLSKDETTVTLFAVNRNTEEALECALDLPAGTKCLSHLTLTGDSLLQTNTPDAQPVQPRELPVCQEGKLTLPAASWNMIRYQL